MRPRNNRPYRLPARFASFEFIFPVEFKFSSNMRGAQLESLLFNYACCPISPPGRTQGIRLVPRRCYPCLRISRRFSRTAFYQHISKVKGLLSDWTGGPSQRSSEFRSADGLLTTGGRDDTELHESQSYWKVQKYEHLYDDLLPLNTQRSLPSSSILSDLQPSEHSDLLRYTAARHWDSTVTNTETQTKLGRVEFRFLSQRETGWGGVIRNPPLA